MKFLVVLSFVLSFLLLAGCAAPAAPAETAVPTEPAVGPALSNPNATEEAKALYEYLCSLSGTAVLSGQMESTWMGSPDYEMDYIFEKTGKYPAIRGLDYMHDDFNGVNERAKNGGAKAALSPSCGTPAAISPANGRMPLPTTSPTGTRP